VAQIPKESIEKVLESTDIVDLIGSYIQLKRAGSQFKANCPFHHEKTPSFTVNPVRQTFHCFGCGKGGDAIAFVREYENLPFTDAVRKLANRSGVLIIEEESNPLADQNRRVRGRLLDLHREAAAFFYEQLLRNPDAAHARSYMTSRGFGREMAERWTVGWMPRNPQVFLDWARARKFTGRELVASGLAGMKVDGNPRAGIFVRFNDRLMFSIRNEIGDVIAFSGRKLNEEQQGGKYINSPETPIFKKSNVLFALDRARASMLKQKSALLCEGQIDAICCHEAGIDHAIATCGTACTQQHARILKRYTSSVVLCYDADNAGIAASEKAFRELIAEGLSAKVVEMPAGDDPDTFLKNHGADAFRELIGNAKEYFDFKLSRARARGALDSAAERAILVNDCVSLLAAMSDVVARDYQINLVASYLQTSASALREAIGKLLAQPRRPEFDRSTANEKLAEKIEPTPVHQIVGWLCHLALSSATAQHFLAEQFETLHEANRWLEGIPLLEKILAAAPDPASHAAVNAFLGSLPESDRLALSAQGSVPSEDSIQAAESTLALLSSTVLQRRDSAVKAALKEPGISRERMMELLQEAKEISSLMRGMGQRHEFDDELPPATFREKAPPWKKWVDRKKGA
jgi:DNA primase